MTVIALAIFVLTVALVVWQPRGLGPARAASLGALLALALGVVHLPDLVRVWQATWNATLTLVALIVISLLLNEAGFFRWAALHIARWGGSGGRLFLLLALFSALTAALFANDGAVLILTPLVLELAAELGLPRPATLAYSLAVGFLVDATSTPLPVSNLVNIVVADAFHISVGRYAAVMLPVTLVTLLASLAALWLVLGRAVPARYELSALSAPQRAIVSRGMFLTGWVLLPLLLLGYVLAPPLGVPLSGVAGAGALTLWGVAARSRHVSSRQVLRGAPWNVVVFSLAIPGRLRPARGGPHRAGLGLAGAAVGGGKTGGGGGRRGRGAAVGGHEQLAGDAVRHPEHSGRGAGARFP